MLLVIMLSNSSVIAVQESAVQESAVQRTTADEQLTQELVKTESTQEETQTEDAQTEDTLTDQTINDILYEWKNYSDVELNEIIANSEDKDIAIFLTTLSDEELDVLLEKDTMLLNEITFYSEEENDEEENAEEENDKEQEENTKDGKDDSKQLIENKQVYWEYLMQLAYKPQATAVYASSKTGYFYIKLSGNGTTEKVKIQVTITSTNLSNQQKATYSWVETTTTSNKDEFKLLWSSANTQLATKTGSVSYYEIAILKFSYKKTAHYRSTSSYENKVDGYRMNFAQYSYENNLPTSLNNTGHNDTNVTEEVYMQINVMNCGMMDYSDGKNYHATGIINLKLYYGGLKVDPNGGVWNSQSTNSSFVSQCTKTKSIQNPTRTGYTFTGWTVTKGSSSGGKINKNTKGSTIDSNGCTFTYCGSHSNGEDMESKYYTTLKANWTINSYKVTCIDVVGENENGAVLGQSTWNANYNTKVSGADAGEDATVGAYYTNYYYTGSTSENVGTGNVTVYRYFTKIEELEMPETGSKVLNKNIIIVLIGFCLIIYTIIMAKHHN